MADEFKNEVFTSYDPNPAPTCGQCGQRLFTALVMLNPANGNTVRMFKCQCGEQAWTERDK
jgi:hypothetical protein